MQHLKILKILFKGIERTVTDCRLPHTSQFLFILLATSLVDVYKAGIARFHF